MFISRVNTKSVFASLAVSTLLAASAQAVTTVIDFDHDAAGKLLAAPGTYAAAKSLTTLYSSLGVTFGGPGVGTATGGAILNSAAGGFSVPARSGANFLAFDTYTNINGPEVITFAQAASNVTIYAAAPSPAVFTMTGYNSAGVLVATSTANYDPNAPTVNGAFPYSPISVNSSALGSISKVVLTATFNNPFYVIYHFDDLSFTVGAPTSVISGVLKLDSIAPNAPAKPFTFELRPLDGSAAPAIQTVSVGPNGAFTLAPVDQKAYTLHIKGAHYLAANVNVNANSSNVSGIRATLPAGDINGDNSVDSTDFGLLIGAYGDTYDPNSATAPVGDVAADLNSDGFVDSTDFGLLINAFGETGAH